ncbi:MAG: rod-binding protein, partial [bacterium]
MKIAPTMAHPPPPTLPGGIEALRGRKDPEALRAAAREMESLFAYEMIKAMRATSGGAASGKGFGGDVYGSLFDMELARVISSRGLGLQEVLLRGIGRGTPSGENHKIPAEAPANASPAPAVENVPTVTPAPGTGANASPPPAVENVPPESPAPGTGANASPAPVVENVPTVTPAPGTGANASPAPVVENVPTVTPAPGTGANASPAPVVENVPTVTPAPGTGANASPAPVVENVPTVTPAPGTGANASPAPVVENVPT